MPEPSPSESKSEPASELKSELPPEENLPVRRRGQGLAFIAALLCVIIGLFRISEGVLTFVGSEETLATHVIDVDKAKTVAVLTGIIGIFQVLCAIGLMRLNAAARQFTFIVTAIFIGNGIVGSYALYGLISTGAIVNLVLGLLVIFLIRKAEPAFIDAAK